MAILECGERSAREINREIKSLLAAGEREITVRDPAARHNLGVALLQDAKIVFDGSVGYYCGGLCDGAHLEIRGSAGWGLAESSLTGEFWVRGNAGNGAGAALRGGTLVIEGDASSRAGVSMKGGTLVIGGDCGYMTGFMAQKGTIIVCGDAGEALGDSMYETQIFVAGAVNDLGHDAIIQVPTDDDLAYLREMLTPYDIDAMRDWKKVVSGRELWNFDKKAAVWRHAL